jgi:hypothetical protein
MSDSDRAELARTDADRWTDYFEHEALSETGRTIPIVTAAEPTTAPMLGYRTKSFKRDHAALREVVR